MTNKPADYGTVREAIRLLREPLPNDFEFDFDTVLHPRSSASVKALQEVSSEHICGTVGCAMGVLWIRDGREIRHLANAEVEAFLIERFSFEKPHIDVVWGETTLRWLKYLGCEVEELTAESVALCLEAIEDGKKLPE